MITTSSVVFCQALEDEPAQVEFLDELYGLDSLVDHILENREKYRFQFKLTNVIEQDGEMYLGEPMITLSHLGISTRQAW